MIIEVLYKAKKYYAHSYLRILEGLESSENMVDRTGYSEIMSAFENLIGERIIEEAQRMGLKKIETYMVIENVLSIMKDEIRKEKRS